MGELASTRDEMLKQIDVVREPLRQIYMCSSQINELQEKKEKIEKARIKKEREWIFVWPVVIFVGITYFPFMIATYLQRKTLVSAVIYALVISGVAFIMFYFDKKSKIKKYRTQESELLNQLIDLKNRRATVAHSIAGSIQVIPPDYQYSLATEYIYSCILNQRAATIGEAVNLYEDQLHKWKMEQMQSKLLEIGVQQQYTLNKIRQADTISAAANVATAVFAGMR